MKIALSGLTPSKAYQVRIIAVNNLGEEVPSKPIRYK